MPPRFAYWTIIAGGLPTAFRATERDELLPTFLRLKEKHPDAQMKWFARGKLWESPDEAKAGARPPRDERGRTGGERPRGEHRGKDWRPGGEHRDPRQPFKDAKKARNQRWREERHERRENRERRPGAPQRQGSWREGGGDGGPAGAKRFDDRQRFGDRKPSGDQRPRFEARPPREKPHGDKLRAREDRPAGPKRENRPGAPKRQGSWREGGRDGGPKREESRREGGREGGPRDERRPWQEHRDRKPAAPREKPHGDKLQPRRRSEPRSPGARTFHSEPRGERNPANEWRERNQGTEEPPAPPAPRGPNREPRPHENPEPSGPPRPSEPTVPPPGPPERGRKRRG
jgi:hypothetical protein